MGPRFTLKALLLVVTLICLGLGVFVWQKRIVDERKALLAEIVLQGGGYLFVEDATTNYIHYVVRGSISSRPDVSDLRTGASRPWLLRQWLGDTAIPFIWLHAEIPAELAEQIPTLFPEAQMRRHLTRIELRETSPSNALFDPNW